MKKLYYSLQPVKFRLAVFGLLCGATVISLLLFRLRTQLGDSTDYAFLVWNIFLAWIPLGLAYATSACARQRRPLQMTAPLVVALWLIFFPNAPYILTDLQHLGIPKPEVPLWFDMLMLLWFSSTGLLLGLVSLFLMHAVFTREFGRLAGWVFVFIAGSLCSLGIYIGRFLRWNSWDLFFRPLERLPEFMYYATHPSLRSILFISTLATFLIFIYITLYTFGRLLHEQTRSTSKDATS